MQFNHNADHPAVNALDGSLWSPSPVGSSPPDFPQVQPTACARITTRVFHPTRRQVATVHNVLVKTVQSEGGGGRGGAGGAGGNPSDVSWSSDDMSSDDEDGDDVGDDDAVMRDDTTVPTATAAQATSSSSSNSDNNSTATEPCAYWIQRTIREAIYGRVWLAIVLRKRSAAEAAADAAEWRVTQEFCAVKEMSWQHIRKERNRLAEDPIKEVAAMQYLRQWHLTAKQRRRQQQQQQQPIQPPSTDPTTLAFSMILETNIMMPLDLLTDDRNLYSIMPYCNGGELFERLDMRERFTEGEARYWMVQVLNVSASYVVRHGERNFNGAFRGRRCNRHHLRRPLTSHALLSLISSHRALRICKRLASVIGT